MCLVVHITCVKRKCVCHTSGVHIRTTECVMHTIYNQDVASWLQSAGKFKSKG